MPEARPARRRLGQYFTPEPVAVFAWRALRALGMRLPGGARVADPALGEGAFLRAAERSGALPPDAVLIGVDLDPAVSAAWPARWRTGVGDGLLDHPEVGLVSGAFDAVAGNPPFGGDGLAALAGLGAGGGASEDPAALALGRAVLSRYRIWRAGRGGDAPEWGDGPLPSPEAARTLRRLARFPVEVLFLERFAMLLRPGGHLACVLPEGILSNAEARPWRDALLAELDLLAVIGLPDGAFRRAGAAARTALLLARRRAASAPRPDVWMAAPEPGADLEGWLDEVLAALGAEARSAA